MEVLGEQLPGLSNVVVCGPSSCRYALVQDWQRLDEARRALMDQDHHTCVVFHCVSGRTRSVVHRNSCNICFNICIYRYKDMHAPIYM